MKRLFLTALAVVAILLAGAASVRGVQPEDLHCPGYNDPVYTKIDNPGNDVVLEEGTNACVKGGQADPTTFTADGVTTLGDYLPGKYDVSYVVIYSTPTPSPTVTPTPTPSPTPSPTPEPTVTPSPSTPPSTPFPTPPPTSTDGTPVTDVGSLGSLAVITLLAGVAAGYVVTSAMWRDRG